MSLVDLQPSSINTVDTINTANSSPNLHRGRDDAPKSLTSTIKEHNLVLADENTVQPSPEARLSEILGQYTTHARSGSSMERAATDYPQTGLPAPYPHALSNTSHDEPHAENASAAVHYPPTDPRTPNGSGPVSNHSAAYSAAATPNTSAYAFPEHLQRAQQQQYHPPPASSASMAQQPSPSLSQGRPTHLSSPHKSDSDVPIDPSISASSPTYQSQHQPQYSPYPPQQDMQQHGYPPHQSQPMYQQPRPDWGAGYGAHPQHMSGYQVSGAQTPNSAASTGSRTGQVYSFVPIPGAQQHKRPRRRYEEIERMYKCGWHGCEKAYGTLNHLNAHVTMQSHGQKRTPEEFKEIRKDWKARKKEEENARKAEDERRAAAMTGDSQQPSDSAPPSGYQPAGGRSVQLPPIGYQPGAQVPGQYQAPPSGVQQLQEFGGNNHMQYSGYPASPYGPSNQMYNQHNGATATKYEH